MDLHEDEPSWHEGQVEDLTPGLKRIARWLLVNDASVDDVVQEVWLKSLEVRSDQYENLGAWLRGVTRNLALRERARTSDRPEREQRAARPEAVPPADLDIEREGVRAMLLEAIAELPASQAEAIRLRYFDELSVAGVAARIERPYGTVKTWLQRGLNQLRTRLEGRLNGRRALGLALVGAFDWEREDIPAKAGLAAGTAAVGGLAFSLWWAALPALALLGATWWWMHDGDADMESARAQPPPNLSQTTPTGTTVEELSDAETPRVAVETGGEAAPEQAAPAEDSGQPPPAVEPGAHAAITLIGVDDAGVPVGHVWCDIWNGVAPKSTTLGQPRGGPGNGGTLTIQVQEEYLYRATSAFAPTGAMAETVRLEPFAVGYAREDMLFVSCAPGSARELVVVFDAPALDLTCRVRAPDGSPIPGAHVRVGENLVLGEIEPGILRLTMGFLGVTDATGAVSFAQERAGRTDIEVNAAGYLPRAWVFDTSGETSFVAELQLDPGVEVVGVVRDEDGSPMEAVMVWAEYREYDASQRVRSGPDGSYRLPNVPLGSQHLWAQNVGNPFGANLVATRVVDGRPGQRLVWDPVLEPATPIRVQVLDEAGDPLVGAQLNFRLQDAQNRRWGPQRITDEAGEVFIWRDPGAPVMVNLLEGNPFATGEVVPFKTLRDLRPREEPYRIQISAEERPRSAIRGRFLDASGRPWSDAKVSVAPMAINLAFDIAYDSTTGDFGVEHLPKGKYVVRLERERGGLHALPVTLAFEEQRDLGTIQTEPTSRLTVTSSWPRELDGQPVVESWVMVTDEFGEKQFVASLEVIGTASGSYEVLPGHFWIRVQRGAENLQMRKVRIGAGEEVEVELGPQTPFLVPVRIALAEGAAPPTGLERSLLRLGDGEGVLLPEPELQGTVELPPAAVQSLGETLRLESGLWQVRYRSTEGLQGEVQILLGDDHVVQVTRVTLGE